MTQQPTIAQLYNLTDRAATGLSNDEQQRLRDGLARLAEYENTINWMTTCTGCARVLDSCIRETERAEKAEAALTEARRIHRETCPLAQGEVGPGFTCGMCDTLDGERPAAPDGTDTTQPAAHNDGPSTAECAEADRAWPLQKAGE